MTYIVNDSCIRCKLMDCVEVCPVDCFYEGENMLVIHPGECIDCGVCEPECPVEAIKPDTEPGVEKWLSLNAEYARAWPNITVNKAPPPDCKEWEGKPDKLRYSHQIPAQVTEADSVRAIWVLDARSTQLIQPGVAAVVITNPSTPWLAEGAHHFFSCRLWCVRRCKIARNDEDLHAATS